MANTKKMDYVLLGLLSHESLTGYEIKHKINSSLQMFWGASFGSIYPTLSLLERDGFVTSENTSVNARERISYTITDTGREHLRKWLLIPTEKDEIRYETLLKLFFGNENGAEGTLKHIEEFERKVGQNLAELRGAVAILEQIRDTQDEHLYYLLTAQFGVKTYEAYLEWCQVAKEELIKRRSRL